MTNAHKIHIEAHHLDEAQARIDELAKAARRCKAPVPTLTILDRYEKKDDDDTVTVFLVIEVSNTFAKIPDWKFVATIEHLSDEDAIVRVSPEAAEEITATELYDLPSKCDHCQVNRQRNTTYIFKNSQNDQLIQVGSTCIKDFFGHHINLNFFDDVIDTLNDIENFGSSGGGGGSHYSVKNWLQAAMQAINTFGYKKASDENPTKQIMQSLMFKRENEFTEVLPLSPENMAEINDIVEWLLGVEPDNDYHRNLQMVVKYDLTESKHLGLIASMIPAYRYHIGSILRREQMEAEIKTPVITGSEVEISGVIVKVDVHYNDYGARDVMTVRDDRGFLVWGTQPAKIADARKGYRVKFTASVEASDTDECFGFFKRPKKVSASAE